MNECNNCIFGLAPLLKQMSLFIYFTAGAGKLSQISNMYFLHFLLSYNFQIAGKLQVYTRCHINIIMPAL